MAYSRGMIMRSLETVYPKSFNCDVLPLYFFSPAAADQHGAVPAAKAACAHGAFP